MYETLRGAKAPLQGLPAPGPELEVRADSRSEDRRLGARAVHLTYDAVEESRFHPHRPTPEQERLYGSDATFIGRCEPWFDDYPVALSAARICLGAARSDNGNSTSREVSTSLWGCPCVGPAPASRPGKR